MSKIDDAQTAISAAKDSLGEAITTIEVAAQQAQEASEGLEEAGAEANAQFLVQCKDTIDQVAQAVTAANGLLDEANQQAEAGKG